MYTNKKIVFIGSAGSGKTTALHFLKTRNFEKKYISTVGCDVFPLVLETNTGGIRCTVWDCAGNEHVGGLRTGYYLNTDLVVLFDCNENSKEARLFKQINPDAKVVIVNSKCDLQDRVKVESLNNNLVISLSIKENRGVSDLLKAIYYNLIGNVRAY